MISSPTSPTSFRGIKQTGLPDIALLGQAGSGKTTVAELLVQLGYESKSFMAPLYRLADELWGVDFDRTRMQALGKTIREIDPDSLPRAMKATMTDDDGPIVVDDCRFPAEYWDLSARGFTFIRIAAPPWLRASRLKANSRPIDPDETVGETELVAPEAFVVQHTITNDTDKTDLFDAVVKILDKERKKH